MNIEMADRLVALRKAHKLSQEALAEQLGISRQAISKWERAEASPDTDNLLALAKLYGMTMDAILHPEAEKQQAPAAEEESKKAKPQKEKIKKEKVPKIHLPKTELQKHAIKMLKFPFPLFVIALYLILGFGFKIWHPAWLIFLTLPIYYHLGGALCVRRKKARLLAMPVPDVLLSIALADLLLKGSWFFGYVFLILTPLYYWLVACFYHDKDAKS